MEYSGNDNGSNNNQENQNNNYQSYNNSYGGQPNNNGGFHPGPNNNPGNNPGSNSNSGPNNYQGYNNNNQPNNYNNGYNQTPNYNNGYNRTPVPTTTKTIVGFILSLVSILLCYVPFVGLVAGIIAIVLIKDDRKLNPSGLCKAAFVIGIIGIVLSAIYLCYWVLAIAFIGQIGGIFDGIFDGYDYFSFLGSIL